MSVEQKPGVISEDPEYPFKTKDVADHTGVSIAIVVGQMNRDNRIGFASETDSDGHTRFSQIGFDLLVEGVLNRKKGESANHSDDNTKINSRLSHTRQAGEIPTLASKAEIILPNGKIIVVKKKTLAMTVINKAIFAQQNGVPYLDRDISALVCPTFHNTDKSRIKLAVGRANLALRKYGCIFAEDEVEVNGRKARAFCVREAKTKPTSSPESQFPKDKGHF